jgi:hypothetical protein
MRKGAKVARPRKAKSKAVPKRAPNPIDVGKRDEATGEFRPGHRFWRTRVSSGPEPRFADAEALWAACDSYFSWTEDNPIIEEQLVTYKGMTRLVPVPKVRPMTKRGLCRFLGIAHTTWAEWKKDRPELAEAIERAESVIWEQKFNGAAVGIFNGNLVARELGLADKTEVGGQGGSAIKFENITPQHPGDDRLKDMSVRYFGGVDARKTGGTAPRLGRAREGE